MRIFLVIVGVHALLLGFVLLLAGWGALLTPEADEEAQAKKDYENARRKGWLEAWLWDNRYRRDLTSFRRLSAHWSQRPDARKYVYAGAALLAIGVVIFISLGPYK